MKLLKRQGKETVLRERLERFIIDGIMVPPAVLKENTSKLANGLKNRDVLRVTDANGTDLICKITGRRIYQEDGVIDVELGNQEGGAVVRVCDRGPGIPKAHLPHIFDPFFTTGRPGRFGLGLSLSWEMARQNGGWIEAENRPEGGAVFTLWLPAEKASPESDGTLAEATGTSKGAWTREFS